MKKSAHLPVRILIIVLLCFVSFWSNAQTAPADLKGDELKSWLKVNFYDGLHTQLGYRGARLKMYTDIDNNAGIITCVYSGYQLRYKSSMYTNPAPINCEHTVPQSFFNKQEPMRSDLHHLFPTYSNWNSERSSFPFADIDDHSTTRWMYLTNSQTSVPVRNIDFYSEYHNSTFEPREDHKGNCARAIFYFFTMYPTKVADISSVGNVDELYQWHLIDPVDAAERARNESIKAHQGNSNPYIEYPELVSRAWQKVVAGPVAPTISIAATEQELKINWQDINNESGYKIYRSVDKVNFNHVANLSMNAVEYLDTDVVPDVNYSYYVLAHNASGSSERSNVVSATLLEKSNATELFFSEYVEGRYHDKALEIANFTNHRIDLSDYSIKKQVNGSGSWKDTYVLSGHLSSNEVFVICHKNASAVLRSKADVIKDIPIVNFNGNDPIGLFKNNRLIDVIGVYNGGSSNFAKDKTLIRKSSIGQPNVSFTWSEWDVASLKSAWSLGNHSVSIPAGSKVHVTSDLTLSVYPVPSDDVVTLSLTGKTRIGEIAIQLINTNGKVVYVSNHNIRDTRYEDTINVSTLAEGIYLLDVQTTSEKICKRLLVK